MPHSNTPLLADYDFELPEELIAKEPASPRDSCRLLAVSKSSGKIEHFRFSDLLSFFSPGDLIVLNDSRVIPVRVETKNINSAAVEVLFLEEKSSHPLVWNCLARPAKKIKNHKLILPGGVEIEVTGEGKIRQAVLPFENSGAFIEWLKQNGSLPIPPYLNRRTTIQDQDDYQTVFSRHEGSVAAPTAGLHFTEGLIGDLRTKGVSFASVTLHVGYGTFAPLEPEQLLQKKLHQEFYNIPNETLLLLEKTRRSGGKIIATGTTALRALESLPMFGAAGKTDIFIQPGHEFRNVDALITNFHLPQTSLLMLVSAFLGTEATQRTYQEAISKHYRFFSYGDAMLIH